MEALRLPLWIRACFHGLLSRIVDSWSSPCHPFRSCLPGWEGKGKKEGRGETESLRPSIHRAPLPSPPRSVPPRGTGVWRGLQVRHSARTGETLVVVSACCQSADVSLLAQEKTRLAAALGPPVASGVFFVDADSKSGADGTDEAELLAGQPAMTEELFGLKVRAIPSSESVKICPSRCPSFRCFTLIFFSSLFFRFHLLYFTYFGVPGKILEHDLLRRKPSSSPLAAHAPLCRRQSRLVWNGYSFASCRAPSFKQTRPQQRCCTTKSLPSRRRGLPPPSSTCAAAQAPSPSAVLPARTQSRCGRDRSIFLPHFVNFAAPEMPLSPQLMP